MKTRNGGKAGKFKKDFIKIKLSSNRYLFLNKILKLHSLILIVRSVFEENGKYYPQVFLDKCLYDL